MIMVVHFILSSLALRVKFILVDVLGQRSQSSIENTVGIGMPPTSLPVLYIQKTLDLLLVCCVPRELPRLRHRQASGRLTESDTYLFSFLILHSSLYSGR